VRCSSRGCPGSADPPADEPATSLLVVDDDPFIARLLQIELTAAGFEVRTAGNGAAALELALER
jgi:CheY-like chemotaxis protein